MANEQQMLGDPRRIRPQELERDPLSGKTVTVRSHTGTGVSFRGKEYKPSKDGLIKKVPVEAIQAIQGCVFWNQGEARKVTFDIVEEAA